LRISGGQCCTGPARAWLASAQLSQHRARRRENGQRQWSIVCERFPLINRSIDQFSRGGIFGCRDGLKQIQAHSSGLSLCDRKDRVVNDIENAYTDTNVYTLYTGWGLEIVWNHVR
jgi:hypothetical protein